ncbi:hypothetical protein ACFYUY_11475 [Kitasatospora sp. NPDC004745]|uniref:hypothetical protein n=1 Tax=unclassified Kitasatospora TaxID=2633591 RepID=UPI0033C1E96E
MSEGPEDLADGAAGLGRGHGGVVGRRPAEVGDVGDDRTDGRCDGVFDTVVEHPRELPGGLDGAHGPAE